LRVQEPLVDASFSSTRESHQIRVVTFNIWFSHMFRVERAIALIDLCASHEADVLCLQEGVCDSDTSCTHAAIDGLTVHWLIDWFYAQ
jgi:exonuclease III